MTLLETFREYEFAAEMGDLVIDSDQSIRFSVLCNGTKVLDEEYCPDAQNTIRVRHLDAFCLLPLWGNLKEGFQKSQCGRFEWQVGGVTQSQTYVFFSRHRHGHWIFTQGAFSEVRQKVLGPAMQDYVSGLLMDETDGTRYYRVWATGLDGQTTYLKVPVETDFTQGDYAYTLHIGPDDVAALTGVADGVRYGVEFRGGGMSWFTDKRPCATQGQLLFRNDFDLPETAYFCGRLSMTAQHERETALVGGTERTFGVRQNDSYTLKSGPLRLGSDYRLWRSVAQSTELFLLDKSGGRTPIVVDKYKIEPQGKGGAMQEVELTFHLAEEKATMPTIG